MVNRGQSQSNYENAKTRQSVVPGRRPYQTCTKKQCSGWEWQSNHAEQCRKCGSKLSDPPYVQPTPRPRAPRARSRESRVSDASAKKSEASDAASEASLVAILQKQLPQLQQHFPDLAKQVQEFVAPVQAPAQVLHTAQAACQIAYKELSAAESLAANLEEQAAELVQSLQDKVEELRSAQEAVHSARVAYDIAAKTAQDEVQKLRSAPSDVQSNFDAMLQQMSPEQLAIALADVRQKMAAIDLAEKNARKSSTANLPEPRSACYPAGPPAATAAPATPTPANGFAGTGTANDAPMGGSEATTTEQVNVSELAGSTDGSGLFGGGLPPSDPGKVEAPRLAAVGALPPVAPLFGGGEPPSQIFVDEASRLAALGATAPVQPLSPAAVPAASAREGSRSPRRQEPQKPLEETIDDSMAEKSDEETNAEKAASPSPKVQRGDKDGDALSARARSTSSAASVKSGKSMPADHYAALAAGIQDQLPLPGSGSSR
jgi:hypothetical protein